MILNVRGRTPNLGLIEQFEGNKKKF